MNAFKRWFIALVALSSSTFAFAEDWVMVPSQEGGFKVGVDALYLRAANSDLDYATFISFAPNFPAAFERNESIDPGYNWGVYAQIGYLFPCTGNDLTVAYTYVKNSKTGTVAALNPNATTGPIISVLPLGSVELFGFALFGIGNNFSAAVGKAQFTLNIADLEAGQRFSTEAYDIRMYAGARFANINHSLQTIAFPFPTFVFGPATNTFVTGIQKYSSKFKGIGPLIGVDGRYCLGCGFGLDANLSTALLAGTVTSSYFANRTLAEAGIVLLTADLESQNGSRKCLVPVVEGKLGLDYTYILDCQCKSSLVFEAGCQATNFFNVVERPTVLNAEYSPFIPVPPANTGTIVVSQGITSDVAYDGIYFGVKYSA